MGMTKEVSRGADTKAESEFSHYLLTLGTS